MKLANELEKAIQYHNSKVSDDEKIDWYDVMDIINDREDEKEIQQYINELMGIRD